MNSIGDNALAVGLSLGLHGAILGMLVLAAMVDRPPERPKIGNVIEATLIDAAPLNQQIRDDIAEQQQQQAEQERQQREAAERERQQELQALQERQEREAAAEQERQAEANRQREARLQAEREKQDERRREQELADEKLAQLEDIRRRREEAEQRRKLEEQKLAQIEDQRQQQEQDRERELEQQRREQLLAMEQSQRRQGEIASLQDQYILAIQAVVTQNWLRPPTARTGLRCKLRVNQIPGGEVISSVVISPCNADDVTRRSIIAAVKRAEPLPYRGYEEVFSREIEFTFTYDG